MRPASHHLSGPSFDADPIAAAGPTEPAGTRAGPERLLRCRVVPDALPGRGGLRPRSDDAFSSNWGAAEGRDPNRWFDSRLVPPALSRRRRQLAVRRCCTTWSPAPPNCAIRIRGSTPPGMPTSIPRRPPIRCCTIYCSAQARGWRTEPPIDIADYLPSTAAPLACPADVRVDVIVPRLSRPGGDAALPGERAGRSGSAGRAGDRGGRPLAGSQPCPRGSTRWRRPGASPCCATGATSGSPPRRIAASRRPASMTWRC